MDIYIYTQGAHISFCDNLFVIETETDIRKQIPLHMVDSISVFGNVQITTQAISTCLRECIPVLYYSYFGKYIGKISRDDYVTPEVIRMQCCFSDNQEERMVFDRKIVRAKINNQLTVLRRYDRTRGFSTPEDRNEWECSLKLMKKKADNAENHSELMGIEGISGKIYFNALGKLFADTDYSFKGRTKRPPKDPFNAAISMGYTFLLNIITGKISGSGLIPQIGLLHSSGYNRPSLSCDLMEEWRQPIVDSTVIGMLLGNEILSDDFEYFESGVYLSKSGIKKLIHKLHSKMESKCHYISGIKKESTFISAISYQINSVKNMMRKESAVEYHPIVVR